MLYTSLTVLLNTIINTNKKNIYIIKLSKNWLIKDITLRIILTLQIAIKR
jgi:hypothetical protein